MKLSAQTLSILRNFASIEQTMFFRAGNVVSTQTEKIYARATIEETIPEEFAVSELSRLLSVISLLEDPDIDVDSRRLIISNSNDSVTFPCADPRFVNQPPEDGVKISTFEVEFNLTASQLAKLSKSLSVIGASHVIIRGADGDITVEAASLQRGSEEPTGMAYRTVIGKTTQSFKMTFLSETFRMLQGDYKVSISRRKVVRFLTDRLEYWIVAESKNSVFN